MEIDPMTLARARLAMRKAVGAFLFQSNVGLIDFGFKEEEGQLTDSLAIRVHVREKLSGPRLESAERAGYTKQIPKRIDGFETDVVKGIPAPQLWPGGGWGWGWQPADPRAHRSDPMSGGISISCERLYGYGTLGGLVRDRSTGEEMILSNWHVLVGDWGAQPGQRIYQPGRGDGGVSTDLCATLSRDAMSANVDAAVACLTGNRPLTNSQLDLGPVKGIGRPVEGMQVVKSGRRTGVTFGRVTSILPGTAKMSYRGVERMIRHVIKIEPKQPFMEVSDQGDSGAWWLDSETKRVIGLHFAGANDPEYALAMDIQPVLDALNVDIVV